MPCDLLVVLVVDLFNPICFHVKPVDPLLLYHMPPVKAEDGEDSRYKHAISDLNSSILLEALAFHGVLNTLL